MGARRASSLPNRHSSLERAGVSQLGAESLASEAIGMHGRPRGRDSEIVSASSLQADAAALRLAARAISGRADFDALLELTGEAKLVLTRANSRSFGSSAR